MRFNLAIRSLCGLTLMSQAIAQPQFVDRSSPGSARPSAAEQHRREIPAPSRPEPHWWWNPENGPAEAIHAISQVHWARGLIELEDGSQWVVEQSSFPSLRDFYPGQRVSFRPSQAWFGQGAFDIFDLQTRQWVQTSILQGPLLSSPYLRTLTGAWLAQGQFQLSDGTVWEIDSLALSDPQLSTWAIHDVIIIGQNTPGWWSTPYPAILFNCGANHWIPVRRIG